VSDFSPTHGMARRTWTDGYKITVWENKMKFPLNCDRDKRPKYYYIRFGRMVFTIFFFVHLANNKIYHFRNPDNTVERVRLLLPSWNSRTTTVVIPTNVYCVKILCRKVCLNIIILCYAIWFPAGVPEKSSPTLRWKPLWRNQTPISLHVLQKCPVVVSYGLRGRRGAQVNICTRQM